MLHGDLAGGVVSYQAAVMNGAPDGGSLDGDLNDGKDLEGRIFFSPFRKGNSVWKELGFGISGHHRKAERAAAPRTVPAARSASSASSPASPRTARARGTRRKLSFYAGPIGVLGEYARSEARVRRASDGRQFDFEAKAWQATVVFAVAGGKPSFGGLRPHQALRSGRRASGARSSWRAACTAWKSTASAVDAGLIDPRAPLRKVFAWTAGAQLAPDAEPEAGRQLRARLLRRRRRRRPRPRVRKNVVFIRTQISF